MMQTVSPALGTKGRTMTTYERWRDVSGYRPGRHDNSGLRARLSGTKIEDRPIVSELRLAMQEREELTLPRRASTDR
jgi:hypothetical protein